VQHPASPAVARPSCQTLGGRPPTEPISAMRKIHDEAKYEQLQLAMAEALVDSVLEELRTAGLSGEKLREAVLNVSFSVAAIIDGSAHVEVEDDHLVPVLGFAIGRMRDRLLIPHEGGSSELHEFVPGIVDSRSKREPTVMMRLPNPSLQPTCYGWLRQPTQAAELKR
jgi:hypothetical protein